MPEREFVLTFEAPRKADVAGLVDKARRMAETWGRTVVIASPSGYAYRVFRPKNKTRNPPKRLIAVEAKRAEVPALREKARRLVERWGKPVALVSPGGRILAVERPNPAAPAPLGTGERFRSCVRAVRAKGTARDPEAVCAAAGRKKYGARQMAAWAAAGRRHNPARSAAQYGAAQAVLSGVSRIMPRRVARELIDATPEDMRRQFARELARRRRRINPEDAELEQAAQLWREFHGAEPHGTTTTTERRIESATLTDLGRLAELTVRIRPGETARLKFGPAVRLAATPDGGQLYIVGGDQRLDLRKLGLADALPKDHVLVGEALAVTYATTKTYDGDAPAEYIHRFGEEGGERPALAYDTRSQRLYLVGGTYTVRKEGVTN